MPQGGVRGYIERGALGSSSRAQNENIKIKQEHLSQKSLFGLRQVDQFDQAGVEKVNHVKDESKNTQDTFGESRTMSNVKPSFNPDIYKVPMPPMILFRSRSASGYDVKPETLSHSQKAPRRFADYSSKGDRYDTDPEGIDDTTITSQDIESANYRAGDGQRRRLSDHTAEQALPGSTMQEIVRQVDIDEHEPSERHDETDSESVPEEEDPTIDESRVRSFVSTGLLAAGDQEEYTDFLKTQERPIPEEMYGQHPESPLNRKGLAVRIGNSEHQGSATSHSLIRPSEVQLPKQHQSDQIRQPRWHDHGSRARALSNGKNPPGFVEAESQSPTFDGGSVPQRMARIPPTPHVKRRVSIVPSPHTSHMKYQNGKHRPFKVIQQSNPVEDDRSYVGDDELTKESADYQFNDDTQNVSQDEQHNSYSQPIELDYDEHQLAGMTFDTLHQESFDHNPRATPCTVPDRLQNASVAEKFDHFCSREANDDHDSSKKAEFFSSLSIDEHEECGDLIVERFGTLMSKFKEARREKRKVAREFEEELACREADVRARKEAVEIDMQRLKKVGAGLLRGQET
ncbi:hypothetical protein MMC09_000834 [Bachmanniomyces sp. S44760]|nr:hypothetical protein [Bachmanniomyces sp. S44760]